VEYITTQDLRNAIHPSSSPPPKPIPIIAAHINIIRRPNGRQRALTCRAHPGSSAVGGEGPGAEICYRIAAALPRTWARTNKRGEFGAHGRIKTHSPCIGWTERLAGLPIVKKAEYKKQLCIGFCSSQRLPKGGGPAERKDPDPTLPDPGPTKEDKIEFFSVVTAQD
jgi:hypothetical protein